MGIEGLHPLLKSAIHRVDIKSAEFRGTTCAVDTSFLLHRGAYACAGKLAQKEATDRYVQYVTRFVERLLEWHIKPIMVFDGSPLPAKRITNSNRSDERERNRLRAQKALASGKTREAEQFFQRAIEITPDMVLNVIRTLRTMGVDVIVAPYEADAQLTYLNVQKIADYVITEDSDLVLFGCHHILFKLDDQGNGELFERSKLDLRKEFGLESFERFRWMCILSGCDYLDNIAGIGLAKAKKIMSRTQVNSIELILKQLPQNLGKLNLRITDDYIKGFQRAHLAFLHQVVYDPLRRQQIPLNPLPDDIDHELLKFSGQCDETPRAFQHAIGNLNVKTKCLVDKFDPSKWKYRPPGPLSSSSSIPAYLKSIWSEEYATRSKPFSLTSTPVHQQQQFPATPSPPRKIRPPSISGPTSTSDVLSTSALLNMYASPATEKKEPDDVAKASTSTAYHTSIIQSIEMVKRPRLFDRYDNDTSSRFFSSFTTTSAASVFDAISENQPAIVPAAKESTSPMSNNSSKRFKRLTSDDQKEAPTLQTSIDEYTTPNKHARPVLTHKSSNVADESTVDLNAKTLESVTDHVQNEPSVEASEPSSAAVAKATSPVLQLPQHLLSRFSKQASSQMVRQT